MLLNLIGNGFTKDAVISLLLFIPTLLISLTVHEYCHGYAAYKCGDNTAEWNGRLTLNPLQHLDPIGTIMMLIFGFGYAKPVPINPRNFKNYRWGLIIVALAGPLSNVLLALIGLLLNYGVFQILALQSRDVLISAVSSNLYGMWSVFIYMFITANASLAVFNLLPIPPLDGSRIISSFLPAKLAYYYNKYESYIMLIVLALLYLNILDGVIFFLRNGLLSGLRWLIELIPFTFL